MNFTEIIKSKNMCVRTTVYTTPLLTIQFVEINLSPTNNLFS